MKIALSFSASIDAGVVVVVVCSVKSKRHDGAGIIYTEERGAAQFSHSGGRGCVNSLPRVHSYQRRSPFDTYKNNCRERLKSMIFVWIACRAREVSSVINFCLSALKSFRVDDAGDSIGKKEGMKEGKSATHSLRD